MHGWDMMSQGTYETHPTWCGTTMIKPEPQNDAAYGQVEQKPQMMLRGTESNPTSPHSIGSDESAHQQNMFYGDPIHSLINSSHIHRPLGFNPLTPPGYPNVCLPQSNVAEQMSQLNSQMHPTTPTRGFNKADTTNFPLNAPSLTPSHTPPMDQTPPKSPKFRSDMSDKDVTDLDNSSLSGDETKSLYSDYNQEISLPKVNSHGKVKTHKCKHCEYVAVTKKEFWEHSRQHIKPERQIQCTKCPFVTEYKHHFEYHLRNHEGSKPFKCTECNYTCVNKSMLNSHLKSHSDIYQYRCENCSYATKYVHSLKLHLRKYDHQPAVPLDSEGIPDPTPIIDVYGTRRGPKKRGPKSGNKGARGARKSSKAKAEEMLLHHQQQQQQQQQQLHQHQQQQQQQQQQIHNNIQQQQDQQQQLQSLLPSILPNHFANMFPYFNLNIQMLAAHQQALAAAQLSPNRYTGPNPDENDEEDEDMVAQPSQSAPRLDVTNPESPSSSVPNTINRTADNSMVTDEINNFSHGRKSTSTPKQITEPIEKQSPTDISLVAEPQPTPPAVKMYDCKFCGISFQDAVLHTIHMGYHGYNDVFTCNMCGEKCTDRISFFLHIAKNEHS